MAAWDVHCKQDMPTRNLPSHRRANCATQKFHPAVFNPMQHCYILIAGFRAAQLYILNGADFKGVPAR